MLAGLAAVAAATAFLLARDGSEPPARGARDGETAPVTKAALAFATSLEAVQDSDRRTAINHLGATLVPARKDVEIPLAFEDSRRAMIFVSTDSPRTFSARVGETALVPTSFFGEGNLVAELGRIANAHLTLTNRGPHSVSARVMVVIRSTRRLDASITPSRPLPGGVVQVGITGTELSEGDRPHIYAVDLSNDDVVLRHQVLGGDGPPWSTTFAAPQEGAYLLFAWVGGVRPRYDSVIFQVGQPLEPSAPATTMETSTTDRQ